MYSRAREMSKFFLVLYAKFFVLFFGFICLFFKNFTFSNFL